MKKGQEKIDWDFLEEGSNVSFWSKFSVKKKLVVLLGLFLFFSFVTLSIFSHKELVSVSLGDEVNAQFITMPIATTSVKKAIISIPSGMVKANPFLPYRNIGDDESLLDISSFDLVEPPETVNENSDAARVMDTIVSGILFDRHSPSAILNIEGNDYLVKKGDTVNNYKVLNILEDSVTVKLGENVYQAGIGEILTEGTLNHNNVSNLNNKFGGVQ
jgi:hypothetical protein